MSKPVILAVDDDPVVAAAVARDLDGRYGTSYQIVRATSGPEALSVLARLALRDQPAALIVADQRAEATVGEAAQRVPRDQAGAECGLVGGDRLGQHRLALVGPGLLVPHGR